MSEDITEINPEDLIKEEDVAITFTTSGYIKRTSLSNYHFQIRGGKGRRGIMMKAEDVVQDLFVSSTHSYLLVFSTKGRMYWLKALEVLLHERGLVHPEELRRRMEALSQEALA